MKKLFFSLAFMLIGTFAFANNDLNESVISKQITSYSINGKEFTPKEFTQLDSKVLELAKACTVTFTITVNTPAGPQTMTHTETFEASWFGCLLAKAGAFLASIWNPSI